MMKLLFLYFLTAFTLNVNAVEISHGTHKGDKQSLVSECLTRVLPSPHCGRSPTSIFDGQGKLHIVFSQNGHIYYSTSQDQGKTFSLPSVINRTAELIYDDGENRPKIVLGHDKEVFVSWTHKTQGRYSGDIRFARSLNLGKTFEEPMTINSDDAIIGHRFESMTLDEQGRLYIIWIDKRDAEKAKGEKQSYAGAALYFAVSENSGESFLSNQKLVDHSCECCRLAIDNDNTGKVVALWRHVYPINLRDHAISYVNTKQTPIIGLPTKASNDGWVIDGCPHHGPDLSIDKNNIAHMTWFTQGEKNKGLMYGQFDLKKQTIQATYSIDKSPATSRPQVQVLENKIFIMWKKFNGSFVELLISQSDDLGQSWSPNKIIATTKNGSDHPDWVVFKKELFISWHTQTEGLRVFEVEK